MIPMKKALRILLAVTIVGSLFAVGFAGSAAAEDYHKKKPGNSQANWQAASSHVDQDQHVAQGNWNEQDDNYAISGAINVDSRDGRPMDSVARDRRGSGAESGDAVAIQASAQSNKNLQKAYSNAENKNWQSQD